MIKLKTETNMEIKVESVTESCSRAKSLSFTIKTARTRHPINIRKSPVGLMFATFSPSALTIPSRTRATDTHVLTLTFFLIVNSTTGSTTTVIEKVNAPEETSK